MLEGIETLMALEKFGTISETAVRLRLTQSAVSKRIQALERELNMRLIEPDGRKVKLTSSAYKFLNKARPLIIELKNLTIDRDENNISSFSLGVSDSIAGSFGPKVVNQTLKKFKSIKIDFHVHRTLMLIENLTLGKYQLGICTDYGQRNDLISFPLFEEPMVLLPAELDKRLNKNLPLITIEEKSATWKCIYPLFKENYSHLLDSTQFIYVESFLAVYQMSKVGMGNGLIPLGLAMELGLKKNQYRILKIKRPISLVTRKTISQLDFFEGLYLGLKKNIENHFE